MATTPRNTTAVSAEAKEDSLVIKASAGILHDVMVVMDQTDGTTDRCVMLFNSATLPANGTDPDWRFPVTGSSAASYTFGDGEPMYFDTGIVVALSSTWDDLTVTTADEAYFSAKFE